MRDGNPHVPPPVCVTCNDARVVTKASAARKADIVPCPSCGDPLKRERLLIDWRGKFRPGPALSERDLTARESAAVKDWREKGHHMADCLRWIEGQRFNPEKESK